MSKKCCQHPPDVPAWFMTYSDVITLLMTFFILLLTFATNEPENFERMQVAMFGGGSASGVAGHNEEALDRDSLLLRIRPNTARLTLRGSEMPSVDSDPTRESLDRGLKSLEQNNDLADAERLSITVPLTLLVDQQGTVTELGAQQMKMVATQMRRVPVDARLEVSDAGHVKEALQLADQLVTVGRIASFRIAVAIGRVESSSTQLRMSFTRTMHGREQ